MFPEGLTLKPKLIIIQNLSDGTGSAVSSGKGHDFSKYGGTGDKSRMLSP